MAVIDAGGVGAREWKEGQAIVVVDVVGVGVRERAGRLSLSCHCHGVISSLWWSCHVMVELSSNCCCCC